MIPIQPKHFTPQLTSKFNNLLQPNQKIGIICHARPDADAIGSLHSLQTYIQQTTLNKPQIMCSDPHNQNLNFISPHSHQKPNFQNLSTIIFVDCSNIEITQIPQALKSQLSNLTTINIDHHISNNKFANHNFVFPNSSSTTEAITELFINSKTLLTSQTATQLLAGIYFDTGSLMHSNTTPHTLKIASYLLQQKANQRQISKYLFKLKTAKQLKLYGKVIQKSHLNQKQVLSSSINQQDFQSLKCTPKDLEGSIDLLNKVPNKKLAILLHETKDKQIKASMRTQQKKQDLSRIAKLFKGGGHTQAAGFSINGQLQDKTHIL